MTAFRSSQKRKKKVFRFSLHYLPLITRDEEVIKNERKKKNKVALRVHGDGAVDMFAKGLRFPTRHGKH